MDVTYDEKEWTESGHALLVFSVIFIQTHAFDQVINFSRLALQSAVFFNHFGARFVMFCVGFGSWCSRHESFEGNWVLSCKEEYYGNPPVSICLFVWREI
jgi:hypothetical protein